jgi:TolA-binding protein
VIPGRIERNAVAILAAAYGSDLDRRAGNRRRIEIGKRKNIERRLGMFARVAFVAFLGLLFSSVALGEDVPRIPESAANGSAAGDTAKGPTANTSNTSEREMAVGLYYLSRQNYTGAINRFKVVVTRFPSSPLVDEALFRLVEAYLRLGIDAEARTAAAVLNRKFPDSRWRSQTLELLKAAGLQPAEDEKEPWVEDERSWISRAFR